jgi:hypothetical protein
VDEDWRLGFTLFTWRPSQIGASQKEKKKGEPGALGGPMMARARDHGAWPKLALGTLVGCSAPILVGFWGHSSHCGRCGWSRAAATARQLTIESFSC